MDGIGAGVARFARVVFVMSNMGSGRNGMTQARVFCWEENIFPQSGCDLHRWNVNAFDFEKRGSLSVPVVVAEGAAKGENFCGADEIVLANINTSKSCLMSGEAISTSILFVSHSEYLAWPPLRRRRLR